MPSGVYKRTKMHREKISLAKKGHIVSKETREKISQANGKWNKNVRLSYSCVHRWVVRFKGKAVSCQDCGIQGKRKYEWSNVDHKYRKVLKDYISRCTSCHRKYDLLFLKA